MTEWGFHFFIHSFQLLGRKLMPFVGLTFQNAFFVVAPNGTKVFLTYSSLVVVVCHFTAKECFDWLIFFRFGKFHFHFGRVSFTSLSSAPYCLVHHDDDDVNENSKNGGDAKRCKIQ